LECCVANQTWSGVLVFVRLVLFFRRVGEGRRCIVIVRHGVFIGGHRDRRVCAFIGGIAEHRRFFLHVGDGRRGIAAHERRVLHVFFRRRWCRFYCGGGWCGGGGRLLTTPAAFAASATGAAAPAAAA